MPPKVPAPPPDVCEPVLTDTGLTAQDIRALFRDPDCLSLESRNQQVIFLFDFARFNSSLGLSNQFLARVFNISLQYLAKFHCKARKSEKPPHRPLAPDENQEISVLEFILSGFSSDNYITQREILSFVAANFGKQLTFGWRSSFLDS
jgi:hypothetical protein